MGFSANEKVTWQDLVNLYSALNAGRTKFGFNTVNLVEDKVTKASQVGTVNALVNEMSSNKYLNSVANTNVTVPSIASLLQASFTFAIQNTVTNINNTCAYDGANFTTNRSGFNGANFTTNRSGFFASSHFTGNRSGFDGSDFSGNRSGFNSGGFSTNRSGFNGSFGNTSNFTTDFPSREAGFSSCRSNFGVH